MKNKLLFYILITFIMSVWVCSDVSGQKTLSFYKATGKVIDSKSKTPIPLVRVSVDGQLRAVTDENGIYTLYVEDITSKFDISFHKENYMPFGELMLFGAKETGNIEIKNISLEKDKAITERGSLCYIEGFVVDKQTGAPLVSVNVSLGPLVITHTDIRGYYIIASIPQSLDLVFRKAGYNSNRIQVDAKNKKECLPNLELEKSK